jgi:hypothetical protein
MALVGRLSSSQGAIFHGLAAAGRDLRRCRALLSGRKGRRFFATIAARVAANTPRRNARLAHEKWGKIAASPTSQGWGRRVGSPPSKRGMPADRFGVLVRQQLVDCLLGRES